jgi:hypothetical protein
VDADPTGGAYSESLRLTVPNARVAADAVEGEAVIVNLDTGAYYTTEGSGCEAWELLASGRTIGEVVASLATRYVADDGAIEDYVQDLVATLLAEGLMHVRDADEPPADDEGTDATPGDETRAPFAPVALVSYHDMKGLLLLDPVHEVEAEGWPHAATGG